MMPDGQQEDRRPIDQGVEQQVWGRVNWLHGMYAISQTGAERSKPT